MLAAFDLLNYVPVAPLIATIAYKGYLPFSTLHLQLAKHGEIACLTQGGNSLSDSGRKPPV